MTLLATRRAADDLQTLLEGGRPRSARAADELGELVTLASALRPVQQEPRPEFRAALRERLLAEAISPAPAAATKQPSTPQRRSASWRLRQVTATIAAAAVVAGAGAAAASTRALPGDTLYGLKRQIEQVQLSLARGDVAQGSELLDQADARLSEAEALIAAEHGPQTDARVSRALTDMNLAFTRGADDLTQAYRDTGDDESLRVLDRFITEHRDRLADLITLLDPDLRAQARELANRFAVIGAQLAALLAKPSSLAPVAGAIPEDGQAVRRDVDSAHRAAGTMSGGLTAAGDPAAGTAVDTGGAVGDLLDALGGTTAGATDTGSGTSGGTDSGDTSDGLLGDLTGEATTSGGPLPTTSPLPGTTLLPSPISSALPSDPVGEITSAVPLPVETCVPLPPLTTC